jgi:hypothetical protein
MSATGITKQRWCSQAAKQQSYLARESEIFFLQLLKVASASWMMVPDGAIALNLFHISNRQI